MAPKIDLKAYASEVRKNMNLEVSDEIIETDLVLTLILAELEKAGLGRDLIFKGGTLLSRNYLKYHRFSEDLDFVFRDSNAIRKLTRNARERKVKIFLDYFVPELKKVADVLEFDFSTNRSDKRYCRMLTGRTVYTFKVYYSEERYIKVEINFIEKVVNPPIILSIKAITDFFDSKALLFTLGLEIKNFNVLSYPLEEIELEKYRAILTRKNLAERDLFDLYFMPNSSNINIEKVVDKIESSSLIKKQLTPLIEDKLLQLEKGVFFASKEKMLVLSITKYEQKKFEEFKQKIQPKLIEICNKFLEGSKK